MNYYILFIIIFLGRSLTGQVCHGQLAIKEEEEKKDFLLMLWASELWELLRTRVLLFLPI